jgi:thioredoxin reductase
VDTTALVDWNQVLTWAAVSTFIAVLVIPYWRRHRRQHEAALKRFEEAKQLGLDKAKAQYPHIDPALCIGCGSCVGVCPEYDVLAVIHGVATVVNGQRCVGHAKCEEVCPVGALTVGLGDISGRDDIPVLTANQETSVSGLYIAGELGGISLIRNAITQGRTAVEHITASLPADRDRSRPDVLIVGSGPAGLTAALTAIQNDLSHVVLERSKAGGTIAHYPRRKLVMTQPIEIPLYGKLKQHEYEKETLLDIWNEIIQRFGVEIHNGQDMIGLQKNGHGFIVDTTTSQYSAHRVVFCLGRRGTPRKLGVPGEGMAKVVYQLLDAQSYCGRHVLVVGGGDSAVEAAVALGRQDGTRVSISYRKRGFPRIKKKNEDHINAAIAEGAVTPLYETTVERIEDDSVTLASPKGEVTVPNDDVIVLIGGVPPFAMLKEMGIRFGGEGNARHTEGRILRQRESKVDHSA